MSTLIHLNLEQIMLYGYQSSVSDLKVDAIIRGIEAGDIFPPVFVRRRNDHEYELGLFEDLDDRENYGGHHRAVAHYLMDAPLRCQVREETAAEWEEYDLLVVPTLKFVRIKDILIAKDRGEYLIAKGNYKRRTTLPLSKEEARWR